MPSVDIITTGRPDLTEYAAEYGYLRGARLDKLGEYEVRDISVDFLDMHWENPQPDLLVEKAREHTPKYVIAGDYLRDEDNVAAVNDRADRLSPHAENVIVVPKSPGDLAHVPDWCIVGYSTPTDYGGTDIKRRKYRETHHDIHILGGTPHQQHRVLADLWVENVVSMDCNSHHKAATIGAKAWYPARPRWRKVGPEGMANAVEQAYKISVGNLNREHQRRGLFPATDGGNRRDVQPGSDRNE